ncbi:hypothetical protein [Candidatus Manganitrophus noduliformans]|uniref:Uncharacterized protein n=1 Tax=Candidatus Manganitrophus noduliformans TaxID=2606439 RepID=A0A7X6DNW7_9BACT|nr:hypothetical protein [Candidatus Manganitrophus noduliformans]NKE70625.1 hypothetical protein [Candidatus Manganitrophus noduliformans]
MGKNKPDKEVTNIDVEEIKSQSVDILANLGEVAIDSFLKEGPIKDIPIIGTMVNVMRSGKAIKDFIFMKKLEEFVFNGPNINSEKGQQFREKMERDPDFAKRTATHLIVILDRIDELEKIPIFAKIFGSYINGIIDQEQMRRFASVINRTLLADIIALKNLKINQQPLTRENFYGLEGVGLASVYHSITRPLEAEDVHGEIGELHFVINPTAVQLIKIVFE